MTIKPDEDAVQKVHDNTNAGNVIIEIQSFIQQHTYARQEWYLGLASDVKEMLFHHHNVNRRTDSWIYLKVDCSQMGLFVLETFREWGCGGKDYPSNFEASHVYAYHKTKNTKP
jgi:hypothetical protein